MSHSIVLGDVFKVDVYKILCRHYEGSLNDKHIFAEPLALDIFCAEAEGYMLRKSRTLWDGPVTAVWGLGKDMREAVFAVMQVLEVVGYDKKCPTSKKKWDRVCTEDKWIETRTEIVEEVMDYRTFCCAISALVQKPTATLVLHPEVKKEGKMDLSGRNVDFGALFPPLLQREIPARFLH